MSIDTENFKGEIEAPAAGESQQQNSFERETHDEEFRMPDPSPETSSTAVDPVATPEAPKAEDPQERNFRALTESIEQLKAKQDVERKEHQLQLDMLRANLVQRPPETHKQKQIFDGMQDSEIPNVGEFRKAWSERENEYNSRIEELQVQSQHSDYAEVLNKYGKQLAETDPAFVQGIEGAKNKALFAYQYAKREQRLQELEAQVKSNGNSIPKSNDAQRIVDNAKKPGTLAQTGGQGVLSKADYFATMSDQDFIKYASKHLEQI